MNQSREKLACRPDQLFGRWAMQPDALVILEDRAVAEVEAGRLAQISAASKEVNEEAAANPYAVENGVARIAIDGPITKDPTSFSSVFGGTSTTLLRAAIREADRDPDVKAILYDVNSPGGTALGIAEAARAMKDAKKPNAAHVNGSANSGAYWLASHAQRIVADPTAEVGSIGAFTTLTDRSENLKRQGIEKHLIASGDIKGAGADGVKITEKQKASVQTRIDDLADAFIGQVADARGMTFDQMKKVADGGRVYSAPKALKLGLIDDIGFADDVVASLANGTHKPSARMAPAPAGNNIRAEGVSIMPFTADQLSKIRTLPGGASVSDDQAADWLIGQVSASVSEKTAHQTAIQAKDAMIQSRDAQITELKTKLPAAVDPAMAAERIELTIERNQLLVDQGLCSPAQHKLIVDSLKPGGTANVSAVQPGGVVAVSAKVLHDTFSLNKPFAFGSQTPSQALNRHVPGAQASDDKDAAKRQGEAEGKAFHDKQLAARGLNHA